MARYYRANYSYLNYFRFASLGWYIIIPLGLFLLYHSAWPAGLDDWQQQAHIDAEARSVFVLAFALVRKALFQTTVHHARRLGIMIFGSVENLKILFVLAIAVHTGMFVRVCVYVSVFLLFIFPPCRFFKLILNSPPFLPP